MKEMYIEFMQDKYYKVFAENLEDAIEQIKHYESHVYDCMTFADSDDYGWWNHDKYYQFINYDDIEKEETIYDLTNYKFTYPQKFCKTFEK